MQKLLNAMGGNDLQKTNESDYLKRMVSGMSHDLNNYLNALIGYNNLIMKRINSGDIEKVKKFLTSQQEILNHLYEWSRHLRNIGRD